MTWSTSKFLRRTSIIKGMLLKTEGVLTKLGWWRRTSLSSILTHRTSLSSIKDLMASKQDKVSPNFWTTNLKRPSKILKPSCSPWRMINPKGRYQTPTNLNSSSISSNQQSLRETNPNTIEAKYHSLWTTLSLLVNFQVPNWLSTSFRIINLICRKLITKIKMLSRLIKRSI